MNNYITHPTFITIFRFSENGFLPFEQDFLITKHKKMIEHFKNNQHLYPTHLLDSIKGNMCEYVQDLNQYNCGVFAFLNEIPSLAIISHLTNHLTEVQNLNYMWWKADIACDTLVFDGANIWKKNYYLKIGELSEKKYTEVFIPQQN